MSEQAVEVLWSRLLHLRSETGSLAAGADVLVVAERHSRLVGLDRVSGKLLWEQRVEDCWGGTVVAGERCLYLSQAGVLHCLDLGRGERLWARPGFALRREFSVGGAVVLVGGWRGYHPILRLSLADGEPVPAGDAPHSRQLTPWQDLTGRSALLADADRPRLRQFDPQSGTVVAEWPLPAPVHFPDGRPAATVGDDGSIAFVIGLRTVMVFNPDTGPHELWHHDRDLPIPPTLSGSALWLLDDTGCTRVDLTRGISTRVKARSPGVPSAVAPVAGGTMVAYPDGSFVMADHTGESRCRLRLPTKSARLLPTADGLVHAIGKGHLVTVRAPASSPATAVRLDLQVER